MSELVDMSLDDIIKRNKVSAKGGRSNNQRGSGPKNQSNSKPRVQRLRNLGSRSGITRTTKPSGGRQAVSPRKEGLARLHVSNLHYNVSNRDVSQLFSEIGQIKKAAVHYDKSGRSLGTAEVTFTTRDAAIRAIKKYNQVPLDGRPMNITLVPSPSSVVRSPAKGRVGLKPGSGIKKTTKKSPQSKGPRNSNQRGNNRSSFQKRQPKKNLTAEDLDKDLDDYTMKVDS